MDDHEGIDIRHGTRRVRLPVQARAVEIFRPADRGVRLQPPRADPQRADRARIAALPVPGDLPVPRPRPAAADPARRTATPSGRRARALTKDPTGDADPGVRRHHRLRLPRDPGRHPEDRGPAGGEGKAAVLLMRLEPERPARVAGEEGLELRRDRRVLEDLHPRRLSGRAVRAADASPALPVPPVAVRHHAARRQVIFGPAVRPLPQLPITVDSEGYLVAQSDFHEPVGPSFWERAVTTAPEHPHDYDPTTPADRRQSGGVTGWASRLHRRAHRHQLRRPASSGARSSRTTGRSCSARSRSTASSSSC